MERGVDVEVGIKEQEMLIVLSQLKRCGWRELDAVAVMGFEIEDVV